MEEFKTDIEILKEIVGNSLYSKIKNEFAGRSIYVPKMDGKEFDYSDIYNDLEKGLTFRQIAKKRKCTVVWVRRLYRRFLKQKRQTAPPTEQYSLF